MRGIALFCLILTACTLGTEADQRKVEASLLDWVVAQQSLSTDLRIRLYDAEANADPLLLTAPVSGATVQVNDILLELEEVEVTMETKPFGGILGSRLLGSLPFAVALSFFSPLHAHGEAAATDGSVFRYTLHRPLHVTSASTIDGNDTGGRPFFEWSIFLSLPPGTIKQVRFHLKRLTVAGTVNGLSFTYETDSYSDPTVSPGCSNSGRSGERIQPNVVIDLSSLLSAIQSSDPGASIAGRWAEALFIREHECYVF